MLTFLFRISSSAVERKARAATAANKNASKGNTDLNFFIIEVVDRFLLFSRFSESPDFIAIKYL